MHVTLLACFFQREREEVVRERESGERWGKGERKREREGAGERERKRETDGQNKRHRN